MESREKLVQLRSREHARYGNAEGLFLRIMLLGSRFGWQPTSSAHNFWSSMIPVIDKKGVQFIILSIGGKCEQADGPVPVVRVYPGISNGNVKLETNYILKTLLLGKSYPHVIKLVRKHRVDLIHLIDNYGPGQVVLSQIRVPKTIFQLNYNPRYPFYSEFLKASLRPFDRVVTGSAALARMLRESRIATRTKAIPWAVALDSVGHQRSGAKAHFGMKGKSIVVLWTGFLPLIGEREFLFSMRVARQLVHRLPDVTFVFAFKSEHFDGEYRRLENDRIKIVPLRSKTGFLQLASACDVLFSPCLNHRAIFGPPLTWLECMAQGLPIVTTSLPGVEEVICHNTNGIILPQPGQVQDALYQLVSDPERIARLSIGAKKAIGKRFEINGTADAYKRMWLSVLARDVG